MKAIDKATKELIQRFSHKDCGDLEEYMGCKIDRTAISLKFTQPVLI
jgi:hypothetical protein